MSEKGFGYPECQLAVLPGVLSFDIKSLQDSSVSFLIALSLLQPEISLLWRGNGFFNYLSRPGMH